jgi:general secretion pathway protein C
MSGISLQPNDLVRLLQGRNAQIGIRVVNVLLVIWIAAQLASLTWALLPQPEPLATPASAPPADAAQKDPHLALIEQLPGLHLMGVPTRATAAATSAPVDAPETQLRLTLRGALAADNKQDARAIIADSGGKEEQYAIGDNVPGNAELSEVYPDRVILRRSGRYETLRLPTDNPTGGSASLRSQPALNPGLPPAARLQQIRNQLRNSPRSLYGMLRATPKQDATGKTIGYVVSPGKDPQLFTDVGLQDGDLVTEVNNLSLSDPANGAKALESLQNGETVTVKVLRNGTEQMLTLDAR